MGLILAASYFRITFRQTLQSKLGHVFGVPGQIEYIQDTLSRLHLFSKAVSVKIRLLKLSGVGATFVMSIFESRPTQISKWNPVPRAGTLFQT